jgi:uncharacterized protein DUF6817
MHAYAQTNIQLFNQLRRDGYSDAELGRVRDTYKLAMQLFTGRFRPSGKTFIDHLVGTASILGSLRLPVEVVAAGLIHAAYAHGDFGGGVRCHLRFKRKQVRDAVGHKVEDYVAGFAVLRWNTWAIPLIRDGLESLDPRDRYVLLMRIANEMEDCLDLGVLYCCNAERRLRWIGNTGHIMVEMTEMLGFPALAVELARVFKETAATEFPSELWTGGGHDLSFMIAPKSYRTRLSVVFRHQLVTPLQRLRSAIRVRTRLRSLRQRLGA